MDYEHYVSPEFRRYTDMDTWAAHVVLDGFIAAGESRYYRLSSRFAEVEDWIHTLEPYRDYFWSLYGNQVAYTQNLNTIFARSISDEIYFAPDNLRGFQTIYVNGQVHRVDTDGWAVEVDAAMDYLATSGHSRYMIWKPSGLYNEQQQNNYPPQFMSEWSPPMVATTGEFSPFASAGIKLGFWWGRSAQVADQWNDPELEMFDTSYGPHVTAMWNEAVLAASRGARLIGLDSFRMMPPWDALPWLNTLQAMSPQIQYVGEPHSCDIMHLKQGFCIDHTHLLTAPLLADYLVPGREVWVIIPLGMSIAQASHYIGWGLSVLHYNQSFTAHDLEPAVAAAQAGWVVDPFAPFPQ
jgi:hypothetical protein